MSDFLPPPRVSPGIYFADSPVKVSSGCYSQEVVRRVCVDRTVFRNMHAHFFGGSVRFWKHILVSKASRTPSAGPNGGVLHAGV